MAVIFCLLIGTTEAFAQTWPPANMHKGDIYIDPKCKDANCLDGQENFIYSQLQYALTSPCNKVLNVILLSEDCPALDLGYIDGKKIAIGPNVPLGNNPSVTSNIWWAEGESALLIINPYTASVIGYGGAPLPGLRLDDCENEFARLRCLLENDFAKSYVPYSSKYSCLILEYFKSYYCSGISLLGGDACNQTDNITPWKALKYTGKDASPSFEEIKDERYEIPLTGYNGQWIKFFKSSFCTDVQIIVPYRIGEFTKEGVDWKKEVSIMRNNSKDFVAIIAPFNPDKVEDDGIVDVEVENGSGPPPPNAPLQDKCYPHSRALGDADEASMEKYVEETVSQLNGTLFNSGFRAMQQLYHILVASIAPQPSKTQCQEQSGPFQDLDPSDYFKEVVNQEHLKVKFDGPGNPSNQQEKQTGRLHDFTGGGVTPDMTRQFKEAAEHIEAVTNGAVKVDFVTSTTCIKNGTHQVESFNEAKEKFEELKGGLTGRSMVFFYNYDKCSGKMFHNVALSSDFYQPNGKYNIAEGDKPVLKRGIDTIVNNINSAFLKQLPSSYENATAEGPIENADKINAPGTDKWDFGLWPGVSPGHIGMPGLVTEAVTIVGETVWNGELPERTWNPDEKTSTFFKAPGGIAGIGDGLLEQVNGKVFALIGLAGTAKDFATNKESRKNIIAAFRYPHVMALAQYGTKITELVTTDDPDVRWHHAGYLGTKIIFDVTTGSFLTNIVGAKTDLKKIGADAQKASQAFSGKWDSRYNLGTRADITEHGNPPNQGVEKAYPARQSAVNALMGKLDEGNQKKVTHESGIVRDVLLLGLDDLGNYKPGWNQQKLGEVVKRLPEAENAAFYDKLNGALRDADGNMKPEVGAKFLEDIGDPAKGKELADVFKTDPELVKAWEAIHTSDFRKNLDWLQRIRTWQGAGVVFIKENGVVKMTSPSGKKLGRITNNEHFFHHEGYGGHVKMNLNKVTTILGKHNDPAHNRQGTQTFIGNPTHPDGPIEGMPPQMYIAHDPNVNPTPTPAPGELNVLNVKGATDGDAHFWEKYNKPFLEAAFARGDDVRLISHPQESRTGFFGMELDYIDGTLASQYGYIYDSATFTYKKQ